MLPQHLRLRRSAEFTSVVKRGKKFVRPTMVAYALESASPRFGVIVGKAVGGAVERNSVKRRLRHLAAGLLGSSSAIAVVVRARPAAAGNAKGLAQDFQDVWQRAQRSVVS